MYFSPNRIPSSVTTGTVQNRQPLNEPGHTIIFMFKAKQTHDRATTLESKAGQ